MRKKRTQTVFVGACPVCKKKLKDEKLSIIDKNDVSALCCVRCTSCLSSLMFTVSSLEGGTVTTVGVLSDIQEDDLNMLKKQGELTYDDVLDIHTQLEKES